MCRRRNGHNRSISIIFFPIKILPTWTSSCEGHERDRRRNELINKINEKERQIKDLVEKVNKALPIKRNENHYGFEVGLRYSNSNYDKYDGLAIVSEIGWTVKDTIMEEVSLATMDSYCQEDIFGIIEKLTEQFSGGK